MIHDPSRGNAIIAVIFGRNRCTSTPAIRIAMKPVAAEIPESGPLYYTAFEEKVPLRVAYCNQK
jgi:hypothetical protein